MTRKLLLVIGYLACCCVTGSGDRMKMTAPKTSDKFVSFESCLLSLKIVLLQVEDLHFIERSTYYAQRFLNKGAMDRFAIHSTFSELTFTKQTLMKKW